MSNKLFYRLGLEELSEVAPVAEVPSVSEHELELDVNRIGDDVLNDAAQVDIAQADTTTMEEVKSALESALKHGCDHSSLVFASRTLQMVDKRWGFDYPVASMEDSTETLIASMEDGIGQRLKDMGKALLEMLKKIWAKLKEWGNKFLQLLGLKKKRLQEIKKEAQLIKEERWEEVGGYRHHLSQYSDGSEIHRVSKTVVREDYVAPVPVFAGTHHSDKPVSWNGASKPSAVSTNPPSKGIDWNRTPNPIPHAAPHMEPKTPVQPAAPAVKIPEFNPVLDAGVYSLLFYKNSIPTKLGFVDGIQNIATVSTSLTLLNDIAKSVYQILRGKHVITSDDVNACMAAMGKHYRDFGFTEKWYRDYLALKMDLPGLYSVNVDNRAVGHDNKFIDPVRISPPPSQFIREHVLSAIRPENIEWLTADDVIHTAKVLDETVDRITTRLLTCDDDFQTVSKELVALFNGLQDRNDEKKDHRGHWVPDHENHGARFLYSFIHHYPNKYIDLKGAYTRYLKSYVSALTKHMELSNDYQKHLHLVEMSEK